jgi:hypothetical protein
MITLSPSEERKNLFKSLKLLAKEMNRDRFMLLEYLGPIVDGCRAALNVSVDKAKALHNLSDADIDLYMDTTEQSFLNLTICFKIKDTDDAYSFVFDEGEAYAYDECVEPDVAFEGVESLLMEMLDADAHVSPIDELGVSYGVSGNDSSNIIESLGVLCFTPLLRVARSGVDPSSLLSDNADSIILATASDLVTKIVQKWIDVMVAQKDEAK